MIARYDKRFKASGAQLAQPGSGLTELVDPGALREIAADDDQVGATRLQPGGGGVYDPGIVRAEMNVGQVSDAGHAKVTNRAQRVSGRSRIHRAELLRHGNEGLAQGRDTGCERP